MIRHCAPAPGRPVVDAPSATPRALRRTQLDAERTSRDTIEHSAERDAERERDGRDRYRVE
jgi:hypothetical protein